MGVKMVLANNVPQAETATTGPVEHSTKPQIIFFGNGPLADSALKVLEQHFSILFHARTKSDLEKVIEFKQNYPAARGILASYGAFVPARVLDLFEPEGILNIHPSQLPEYRGPSPIETAILDGKTDFSVSIMKLVKEMDAGPLYYQETLENLPLDKSVIYDSLATAGANWLVKNLFNLPTPVAQQGTPTYTHKFEKKDGVIDPDRETADQIYRKIVAFQGFPKVKYAVEGVNCLLLAVHPLEQGGTAPLMLKCADGRYLSLDRLQPENRKPMDAKSFLNGYKK